MKVTIALFQMTSQADWRINMEKIEAILPQLCARGAGYLFLPECFYSMGDGTRPPPHLVEESGEHYARICALAGKAGVFLIGGSAATLAGGRVVNRAYNFSPEGSDLGHYDKMHLFRCSLGKTSIDESDIYAAGTCGKTIVAGSLRIGLGICFDIRYPGMASDYVREGVDVLTFASAFTVPTGKAHWHTLLRARAIENQCFVVACAQYGRPQRSYPKPTGIPSWLILGEKFSAMPGRGSTWSLPRSILPVRWTSGSGWFSKNANLGENAKKSK